MIFRPNAEPAPTASRNDSDMGWTNLGHKVSMENPANGPVENTAANVHCGAGYHGYSFATDATGENNYPRPDKDLEGLPGITGGS